VVGDDNLIMAYSHAGHNCRIGSRVLIANNVELAGQVTIEDGAILGGLVGVHQFVRVGRLALVGAFSKVVQDVPPFLVADGRPADVLEVNAQGLRRAGLKPSSRAAVRRAYKLLYRANLNVSQALEAIAADIAPDPEVAYLVTFMQRIKGGASGRQDDRPRG
jgi:UDP-N-acetylglucosamine acyltransferase